MKIKRIFTAVLSFIMVLTMLPAMVFAAGDSDTSTDGSTVSENGLTLTKTATLEDDGTYTIDLETFATGSVTTIPAEGTPLDIVLVIDQSGSMAYNDQGRSTNTASDRRMYKLQAAVRSFVGSISQNAADYNADHRIAIAGYASNRNAGQSDSDDIAGLGYNGYRSSWVNTGLYINGNFKNYGYNNSNNNNSQLTVQDYQNSLVSVNNANGTVAQSVSTAINNFKASGGTYTEYGLRMAEGVFQNNSATYIDDEGQQITRKRIVVLFTDGATNSDINTVLERSNNLKNTYNADVYCVGFGSSVDTDFLNYVSSNYVNCSYSDPFMWWGGYSGTYNDNKYSMTASNSGELEEIFDNISEDIQNPTADVDLDENAVLKDVMAAGFKIPDNYNLEQNVSIKTVRGSYISEGNYSFTTENNSPEGISASVNGNAVEVTGFDYAENFIGEGHDGYKLVVQIRGILPTEEAVTNEAVDTNGSTSGIYAAENPNVPAGTFPQPQTILTSKAYVLDYAKGTALTGLDQNTSVTAIADTMKSVSTADNAVTGTYGNSALSQNSVSYTPKTTNWDGYDNLYVFGKTTNDTVTTASANTNGNLWSKVSVIPANNVYYEDDFVTNTTSGTVGIVYTGSWEKDGTSANNSETANNAVHGGWVENDTGLSNDTAYSDGSAQKGTTGATATFTFTGTGVDIYSRTDMTTGTVTANLYNGTEAKMSKLEKVLIVDNKSDSGTYYQIPTLSFDGLDYGTYTVKITVTNQAEDRTTYYLDGIRVYNPIKNQEDDATVQGAYGNEINAVFTSARDLLQSGSIAFIDEDENGNPSEGDYTNDEIGKLAPENEIYLGQGQSITLKVDMNAGNSYYLGLKAPNGTANIEVTNGDGRSQLTIAHSTDLYYVITPTSDGQIVVTNTSTSDNLLSITKLRTTGTGTSGVSENSLDLTEAVNAVTAFKAAEYVAYESEGVAEDIWTEPEENETEDTEETVTVDPGDITIDNSDNYDDGENQEPEQTTSQVSSSWIANLFNSIKNLFSRL